MHANLHGLLALGASVIAFLVAWNVARRQDLRGRLMLLGGFSILAIPALLFPFHYTHLLPEKAWFYELRAMPGSEYLAVFTGGAGGCLAALLPNLLMGFPLFAVLTLGAIPYLKPILSPLPENAFEERWVNGVCLQSTLATCGPASVCTILEALGKHASEREVAKEAFSYSGGTEAWYLARVVRSRDCWARFTLGNGFAPDAKYPAMVGVRHGSLGHFIAVLSVNAGEVIFADPMAGAERLSVADFNGRYDCTGFRMEVGRD